MKIQTSLKIGPFLKIVYFFIFNPILMWFLLGYFLSKRYIWFIFFMQFWWSFILRIDCVRFPLSLTVMEIDVELAEIDRWIVGANKSWIPEFSYFSFNFNVVFCKMIIFMCYWWTINIVSSPCQRQCELLPSLGIRRPLTFHILIFPSAKWTETW